MPKPQATTQDTINPTLLAFKPRQVQLLNLDMKHSNPNISSQRTQTLTHDQKGPLLHAVARFLESNGFSKTLKKFRSEAEIEKSGPKDSLLDLEEMYCKYSEMCSNGGTNVNSQKEKDLVLDLIKEADKICKEKKKKKSKIASDSLAGTVEPQLESIPDAVPVKGKDVSDPETKKKPKDKKKNKSNSDSVGANVEKHAVEGKKDENGIDKGSKKRKRLASEGNDSQPADNREDEESKRRKVEGLKASKGSAQQENSDASLGRAENEENGQVGPDAFQKTPVKQLDGLVNGNLDKTAEKSIKKSMKKEHKDSAEPKTVKAFQRVKVDEVEFVDDKLRDNSYWAKDGAEIGYGAKAQEILGQVRGRDFRHEKTKKKRGTYRGGHIDLQSHSVKFNYSDEE